MRRIAPIEWWTKSISGKGPCIRLRARRRAASAARSRNPEDGEALHDLHRSGDAFEHGHGHLLRQDAGQVCHSGAAGENGFTTVFVKSLLRLGPTPVASTRCRVLMRGYRDFRGPDVAARMGISVAADQISDGRHGARQCGHHAEAADLSHLLTAIERCCSSYCACRPGISRASSVRSNRSNPKCTRSPTLTTKSSGVPGPTPRSTVRSEDVTSLSRFVVVRSSETSTTGSPSFVSGVEPHRHSMAAAGATATILNSMDLSPKSEQLSNRTRAPSQEVTPARSRRTSPDTSSIGAGRIRLSSRS